MSTPQPARTPLWRHLYVQVLCAIAIGALLGNFAPDTAVSLKPLGDGFIKLIKMMIAPVIFCTVVTGIGNMENLKKVGRVGGKALLYFEIVSTIALLIGLVVINVWQPGVGLNADPATLDTKAIASYTTTAKSQSTVDFILKIIPDQIVGSFATGEILQVLLFAVLFGFALSLAGDSGRAVTRLIEQISHALFIVVGFIMKVAPLGALGAMAFTIGKYGLGSLKQLIQLMGAFYLTCVIFILGVLGLIAGACGFSILRFIAYIKEELLIVLGTSSSETVLPRMMAKMERLGCSKSVVGLVIPTGYSFNLDGTSIYLTMAAIFIAQATNVPLSIGDQLALLAVLMLTSKGAAAVTGGGFVTLAATLSATSAVPVAGLTLILGIDRFMSEARALTNLIGNGVATVVVARWEKELDKAQLARAMAGTADEDA